jgi:C1A family cysteine protease
MSKTLLLATLIALPIAVHAQRTMASAPPQRTPIQPRHLQIQAKPTVFKLNPIVFQINNKPDYDLRPTIKANALQVKAQGSRNTCSVFATNFLFEYLWATKKPGGFGMGADFSEEYLNYVKNVACNISQDGGFFWMIDKGYQSWGCYMDQLVPYKPVWDPSFKVKQVYMDVAKKWQKAKPDFIKSWDKTKGASDAQLQKACDYLKSGTPVAGGFLWPNNLTFHKVGGLDVMVVPATHNDVFDGHSVALVGYKKSNLWAGGGYFIIRNSWGSGWGEQGYAYMPFEYVQKYANDLLAYHW